MKKIMSVLLAVVMVLSAAPLGGFVGLDLLDTTASAASESGTCGENITWTFDSETGELVISGTGEMFIYGSYPWKSYIAQIKSVIINSGVTSIGEGAFSNCTGLTSISIPDSVTSIGNDAFYKTGYYNDNSNWENGALYCGNHLIGINVNSVSEYAIREGTITIADSELMGFRKTGEIFIPSSVRNIGLFEFLDDVFLERITVDENNSYYSSEDGVLFDKEKTTLIVYPAGKKDKAYEIPDSVETIKYGAFWFNFFIETVSIPEKVKAVYMLTFYSCIRLDEIYYYGKETAIDPGSWCSYVSENYDEWLEYEDEFASLFYEGFVNAESIEYVKSRTNEIYALLGMTFDVTFQGTIHGYTSSTAEAYANLYDCTFIPFLTEATDEETDINTEFDPGTFPVGTVLLIDKKGQNEDSTFNGKYEYYESFDISFVDENNVKVQPDGTVTVKIPIPQTFNPEKTVVYFVAPDGTQTKLNSRHEGGYIVFEATHFSEYVIVDESSEITTPDEPDVPDEPNEPEKPSGGKNEFFALILEFITKLLDFLSKIFL